MTCVALPFVHVLESADATVGVTAREGTRRRRVTSDELKVLDEQMALVADGDRSAVTPLFRALWPIVHAYCERALGAGADADDAAQQSMEKAFLEASRYDRARPALPWALAIALWECRTVRRRNQRARTTPLEGAPDRASGDASPEDAAIHGELVREARTLLETLSPADREVLLATFSEEVDVRGEVSGATLRKRRERALHRLRAAWREIYGR
jgi:RNA polymerase sigma-70 factor (ECF subfamily)